MSTDDVVRGPRWWVGAVAIAAYIALAAGVAHLLTLKARSDAADFAWGHFPVLPVLIVVAVVLVRRAGWDPVVYRVPAVNETVPRRWWLVAFPVLLLSQVVLLIVGVPWADRAPVLIVVVLVGTLMVGAGEELYFRGILRAAIRGRHGETVTLLVTSAVFGVAHSVGTLLDGVPVGLIAFQVGVTTLDGAVLYGVLRATGRLWVPMLLHGLDDAALYLSSSGANQAGAADFAPSNGISATQSALWALDLVLLISCLRQDRRARVDRRRALPADLAERPDLAG